MNKFIIMLLLKKVSQEMKAKTREMLTDETRNLPLVNTLSRTTPLSK